MMSVDEANREARLRSVRAQIQKAIHELAACSPLTLSELRSGLHQLNVYAERLGQKGTDEVEARAAVVRLLDALLSVTTTREEEG